MHHSKATSGLRTKEQDSVHQSRKKSERRTWELEGLNQQQGKVKKKGRGG